MKQSTLFELSKGIMIGTKTGLPKLTAYPTHGPRTERKKHTMLVIGLGMEERIPDAAR